MDGAGFAFYSWTHRSRNGLVAFNCDEGRDMGLFRNFPCAVNQFVERFARHFFARHLCSPDFYRKTNTATFMPPVSCS